MNRTRTLATSILAVVLLAASVGAASAQIAAPDPPTSEPQRVACEGLNEFLGRTTDIDIDGASITVEVVALALVFNSLEMWTVDSRPVVTSFTCDGTSPTRVPPDTAQAQ